MTEMQLRPATADDKYELAELIYCSLNFWYSMHGRPGTFQGGPETMEVFYDVYDDLDPGHNVVAVNPRTERLMGSCFFHPRRHHVSLGIMNVHPNYFKCGVGRALVEHIIDFTDREGYAALRVTQSAINVDSFSLYNKAGCVPRYAYQDMILQVPESGLDRSVEGQDRVRPATPDDVPHMAALEWEVSGITREADYAYAIDNRRGFWHAAVIDSGGAGPSGAPSPIDGFMISCGHPAMNMLGPCVARSEDAAAALILDGLRQYPGRSPVFLIPMEKERLVCRMYDWGARNCEMHFCQVRGRFKAFDGVNMPSFLPETG